MNRVWTYIIPRALSPEELSALTNKGKAFAKTWTAHDMQLHADFEVFKDRIIVVKVNEQVQGASGCSIDKLGRFIKEQGAELGIDLMDRLQVAFEAGNGLQVCRANEVSALLKEGLLGPETPVYDTTVATENELRSWKKPLKETWLKKYLAMV